MDPRFPKKTRNTPENFPFSKKKDSPSTRKNTRERMQQKRRTVVASFFTHVEGHLEDYTQTETYQGKLIDTIENYYLENPQATFFLSQGDAALQGAILKQLPKIHLKIALDSHLGGFIIQYPDGKKEDFTLESILLKKKSGLNGL